MNIEHYYQSKNEKWKSISSFHHRYSIHHFLSFGSEYFTSRDVIWCVIIKNELNLYIFFSFNLNILLSASRSADYLSSTLNHCNQITFVIYFSFELLNMKKCIVINIFGIWFHWISISLIIFYSLIELIKMNWLSIILLLSKWGALDQFHSM